VREQDVAVTLKNLVYDNPGLRTVYQFGQLALALLNRRAAQIHLAVQFDQVECQQHRIVTVALMADEVEYRETGSLVTMARR
jgi:hypothetical protein